MLIDSILFNILSVRSYKYNVRLEHFLVLCMFFSLSQTRIVTSVNHVRSIFTQLAHPDDSLWIEKEQSLQEGAAGSFFCRPDEVFLVEILATHSVDGKHSLLVLALPFTFGESEGAFDVVFIPFIDNVPVNFFSALVDSKS